MGTLLALAERLDQQPLQYTEVWLAFTGCAATGGEGMCAFLAEHGSVLKDALLLDIESVGIGDALVYLQREGLIRKRRIPKGVEQLIHDSEGINPQKDKIQPVDGNAMGLTTEMGIVWEYGLDGVCLLNLPQATTHLLKTPFIPEYRRLTDTSERLQVSALGRAHSFVWAILNTLDAER
jgi:hypothetical protein